MRRHCWLGLALIGCHQAAPPPPAPPPPAPAPAAVVHDAGTISAPNQKVLDSLDDANIDLSHLEGLPTAVHRVPAVGSDPAQDLVDRVVKSHTGVLRACYQLQHDQKPELAGKLVVHFEIAADGTVAKVTIAEDTLHDDAVSACVERQFARMTFPGVGKTRVDYPLVFSS